MSLRDPLVSQREIDPVLRPEDTLRVGGGIDVSESGTPLVIGANASAISFGVAPTLPANTPGAIQWRTVTITHETLTAVALSQAVNIGLALPAGAMVVGKPSLALVTPFTDGAGASVSLDIGTAGDPDSIIAGADLDAAAVDGQVASAPEGIAAGRLYATATQLLATVTSDVNVDTLTAGEVAIRVPFVVVA